MACAYSLGVGARSLVGWSTRLITGGSGVQVPSGPLEKKSIHAVFLSHHGATVMRVSLLGRA